MRGTNGKSSVIIASEEGEGQISGGTWNIAREDLHKRGGETIGDVHLHYNIDEAGRFKYFGQPYPSGGDRSGTGYIGNFTYRKWKANFIKTSIKLFGIFSRGPT